MYRLTREKSDARLAKSDWFYEASLQHRLLLWQKHRNKGTIWTQHINGALLNIGTVNDLPVVLWVDFIRINDKELLMLYEATSRIVDREIIEKWINKNAPKAKPWPHEEDLKKFDLPITDFNTNNVNGLVQADPNEQAILKAKYGKSWTHLGTGVVKAGEFDGKPILLELTKIRCGKKVIVFWWVCSKMADYDQIDK